MLDADVRDVAGERRDAGVVGLPDQRRLRRDRAGRSRLQHKDAIVVDLGAIARCIAVLHVDGRQLVAWLRLEYP